MESDPGEGCVDATLQIKDLNNNNNNSNDDKENSGKKTTSIGTRIKRSQFDKFLDAIVASSSTLTDDHN